MAGNDMLLLGGVAALLLLGGKKKKKGAPLDDPSNGGGGAHGGGLGVSDDPTKPRIPAKVVQPPSKLTDANDVVEDWGNSFAGLNGPQTFELSGYAYDFGE